MTKERTAPQSPEDMAKAAQEAAVKAAMEQAQSMFGSIPGFQMPEGMQEQIMTQMTAVSNMQNTGTAGSDAESSRNRYGNSSGSRTAKHGICPTDDAGLL